MLSQLVEREAASVWLQNDSSASWNDELSVVVAKDSGLLDKVNDDKLARDVEDLSAIFEELEGGVVDFPLPCDEDDVATGAEVTGDWIGDLDKDAVNVDELSSMFDVLVAEQAGAFDAETTTSEKEDESMDCSDDDDGDYDDDDDEPQTISVQMIPTPPAWVVMAPLDPRSVIKTPVFQNLDSRIPRVEIPRMDLGFGGASFALKRATGVPAATRPTLPVSPKPCESMKVVAPAATMEYRHDASTCWICKSDKSSYKKFALHRYLEKRHRRNWKRGPRYSGRSNVATSRVREGGRFVTTAHWV